MGFRFTLNEKKPAPPEIGEKPSPKPGSCAPATWMPTSWRKHSAGWNCLSRFHPLGSSKNQAQKPLSCFFFGGKIYKFSKRFQKLLKKRIGKVCWKWTGYHLWRVSFGTLDDFLRQCWHESLYDLHDFGDHWEWMLKMLEKQFLQTTSCGVNRIDLDFDSMFLQVMAAAKGCFRK